MKEELEFFVSVFIITYNHENYIGTAIESVLLQRTNFPVQIFIGEDCSTDHTADICLKYQEENPNCIKVIFNEKNIGALANAIQIYEACYASGAKYIAMLEGDDNWIDPYKLQKQVDYLEKNENYSASAHQSVIINENSEPTDKLVSNLHSDVDVVLKDLLYSHPFQTASLVFRSEILKKTGLIPANILSGDRALFLACSCFGPIRYFAKPMSNYRKLSSGKAANVSFEMMKKDLKILPWLKQVKPDFPKFLFFSNVYYTIFAYPANANSQNFNLPSFIKYYIYHLWFSLLSYPKSKTQVVIAKKTFLTLLRNRYVPKIKSTAVYSWFKNQQFI